MIILDQVTVSTAAHPKSIKRKTILSRVNLTIPSDRRIAFFGSSNDDKRVVINVLGGVLLPRAGHIIRRVKVSFPVGHLGGFLPDLSMRKNIAHLVRLYGGDIQTVVEFVERVSGLGPSFDKPYSQLPAQLRKHVGRIVAYSIPFDLYVLTDEIVPGRRKEEDVSYGLYQARARAAGMIIPTQDPQFARDHCEMALVLERGQLLLFDQVEDALTALQHFTQPKKLNR